MYFTGKYSPKEISRKRGEEYSTSVCRVLNNFFFQFPTGLTPNSTARSGEPLTGEGAYRRHHRENGDMQTFFREFSTYKGAMRALRSDRKLNQTPEQFFAEIDATVEELGMDMRAVSEMLNRFFGDGGASLEDDNRFKELWKVLVPIYVALRKKGYTSQDITG